MSWFAQDPLYMCSNIDEYNYCMLIINLEVAVGMETPALLVTAHST